MIKVKKVFFFRSKKCEKITKKKETFKSKKFVYIKIVMLVSSCFIHQTNRQQRAEKFAKIFVACADGFKESTNILIIREIPFPPFSSLFLCSHNVYLTRSTSSQYFSLTPALDYRRVSFNKLHKFTDFFFARYRNLVPDLMQIIKLK